MSVSNSQRVDGGPLAGPCAGAPCADRGPALPAGTDAGRVALLLGVLFGLAGSGSSAAAVAVPALGVDLQLAPATTAWVLSGYVLMLAVATAVYGRVADLAGIRRPLSVGVVLMATGAVIAALAPSFPLLLTGRLLQGAGAAAIPVLATALISARYDGAVRAGALGRTAGVAGAITALGLLAGGILEGVGTWRLALALPAAGLVLMPVIWRIAPTTGTGSALDKRGAVLVAATAAGLVLLVQSPSAGLVVGLAGAALLLLGAPLTVRHVRRHPDGFLPRAVATSRVVVLSSLVAATIPAAWFGLLVAVPAVLADRGWSPLGIGVLLVPSAITGLVASRSSGPLVTRVGPPAALSLAGVLAAVALLTAAAGAASGWAALLVLGVALVSVAFGLGQPALIASVGAAVPVSQRGVALGSATLVFLIGAGVGAAMIGGLRESIGITGCLLLLAALPVAGAVAVLRLRRAPAGSAPATA